MSFKWTSLVFCVLASLLPGTAQAKRPNVVLILIDDLNHYGVTAYGANRISEWSGKFTNTVFSTPRIDRLAYGGLRCDNAYVYPLCEPTRIALMSGQYNSRNFLKCKSQHASEITFGDLFRRAGYATGIFGKWKQTRGTREIHAKDYIYEFGWDDFCCFDVVGERQRYINPNLVINGQQINCEGRTDRDPATGRRWHGPDICNRHALAFIDSHKDVPFFLYYPMLLVHDEHKPTPDTHPHSLFDACDEAKENDDKRFFPDMLAYMDRLIGKVVDRLDEHGLRDNTLIVVMGDNGTKEPFTHVLADGTEYPGGKGGNKDNGLHVPLILSWPGKIPHNSAHAIRSYQGLVDVTDIYPTLCEAPARRVIAGQALTLHCEIQPDRATRQNVIWESSDPEIASVDKFGRLTGHRPGKTRVTVYSWDDAFPTAATLNPTYSRHGIHDTIEIVVEADSS